MLADESVLSKKIRDTELETAFLAKNPKNKFICYTNMDIQTTSISFGDKLFGIEETLGEILVSIMEKTEFYVTQRLYGREVHTSVELTATGRSKLLENLNHTPERSKLLENLNHTPVYSKHRLAN